MTEHRIPAVNWPAHLAEALRIAKPGDTIIVRTEPIRLLAESAAQRMGKDGLTVEITDTLGD